MVVMLGVGVALAIGAWAAFRGADNSAETDPGAAARSSGMLRVITPVWIDSHDPALAIAG